MCNHNKRVFGKIIKRKKRIRNFCYKDFENTPLPPPPQNQVNRFSGINVELKIVINYIIECRYSWLKRGKNEKIIMMVYGLIKRFCVGGCFERIFSWNFKLKSTWSTSHLTTVLQGNLWLNYYRAKSGCPPTPPFVLFRPFLLDPHPFPLKMMTSFTNSPLSYSVRIGITNKNALRILWMPPRPPLGHPWMKSRPSKGTKTDLQTIPLLPHF